MKKQLSLIRICWGYSVFHWGDIVKKNVAQVLPKRSYRGVSVKGGSNLLETMKRKKEADGRFYSSLLSSPYY